MKKMKHIETFKNYNRLNEAYNDNTINEFEKTLNQEKLKKAKNLASMLNLSILEGDIYVKSQYTEYDGFETTKDNFIDLIDDLDIYDIYYDIESDSISTIEPEGEDVEFGDWSIIDANTLKKNIFGNIIDYL